METVDFDPTNVEALPDQTVLVAYTRVGDTTVVLDIGLSLNKVMAVCQEHASGLSRLLRWHENELQWSEYMIGETRRWTSYYWAVEEQYVIELRRVSE